MLSIVLRSYGCYIEHQLFYFFFFRQKTAYELRISDWSSDVCSSDLDESDQEKPGDAGDEQQQPSHPDSTPQAADADELRLLYNPRSEERRVGKECVRTV